jgi:hypothetical protein
MGQIIKKLFIAASLMACFSSCILNIGWMREVRALSTLKLEGKTGAHQNAFEVKGYYRTISPFVYGSYLFFEDGTWVNFHFKQGVSELERQKDMVNTIDYDGIRKNQLRWGFYWGTYRVEKDTIYVYSYYKKTMWNVISLSELRYKILDKRSLQLFYYRELEKSEDKYYETHTPFLKNQSILHFFPVDSIPSSDCWLKERKWIWQNKLDWKEYKRKIKGQKRIMRENIRQWKRNR